MSLARTALRLQGKRVLLADPVIDALCQGRIYDSRIGEFDQREPVPTIIITTEDDDAKAWSANNGGAPFNHVCDLVLEIAMTMVGEAEDGQGNQVEAIGPPATDAELEAQLDLIEERAVEALTVGETPEARLLQEEVTRRITRVRSARFATEHGIRLAIRLVTLTVELKGEDQRDVREVPTGDFAVLPDPLRTVAEHMPAGFSGAATIDLLLKALGARPAEVPFQGAEFTFAPQVDGAPPDRAQDIGAGTTLGDHYTIPGSP